MKPMSLERFAALAEQGYNRIPVVREILADLDTPLSAYLKVAAGPRSFLLESVQGGEKWGRYSIIGLPAQVSIQISGPERERRGGGLSPPDSPERERRGGGLSPPDSPEHGRNHDIRVFHGETLVESHSQTDPLAWLQTYQQRFSAPDNAGLPRFTGGLVGYFGYDTVRYIEPKLAAQHPDPIGTPDIYLLLAEELVVFDNLKGKLYLIVHADPSVSGPQHAYDLAQQRLDELAARLRAPLPPRTPKPACPVHLEDFVSSFPQPEFLQAVAKIKQYILNGDVMQVVLSQRLSTLLTAPPLDVYRALRGLNPSPYLFFLDFGEFQVAGASPEILTRVEHGKITVRPIAGTRPRGKTEEQDLALEHELLADAKERAEHLMLIDLGRNDVGRAAEIGTVKLTENMVIERYSHVMHIVSNVEGQLKSGMSALDALKATFPAGTLSGAPKIRAMEIIDELEPVKRGIYGGAVGYLAWNGDMDTAIAIRTAVLHGGKLYIQAGAGIVADSVPELEWEETMNKARAVCAALILAAAGLE